ncbi:hypothetical protein NQ314_012276 [Rhamnusium bicolor]|uniref:NADP-dependent oxidoreductase domain-containing protein n=1 Tax=Rhamnusium bicolor TaxID=1586634 RepID=A0AAV8XCL9_9CUCU|nr:hypothetical protein NQ314_012276 [Rhamnusium bicolor]
MSETKVFKGLNGLSKTVKLNNGYEMPTVGLGTYKSQAGEVEEAVKYAIGIGYRHVDCAWFYKNEREVGVGIKARLDEGVLKREDLFIVTKLWNNFHDKKSVVPKLRESLEFLQLEYIDLFLIHWPFGFKETADNLPTDGAASYSDVDYLETWEGMEECVNLELTKSIGVSNFNKEQIDRLVKNCTIKPVVNQIEVSLGIGVIPKSVTKTRILENFDIFDLELDSEDIAYLDSCNKNMRISPMSAYADHKYYPF